MKLNVQLETNNWIIQHFEGFFSQRTKVEKQTKEKIDKKETRKKDM